MFLACVSEKLYIALNARVNAKGRWPASIVSDHIDMKARVDNTLNNVRSGS